MPEDRFPAFFRSKGDQVGNRSGDLRNKVHPCRFIRVEREGIPPIRRQDDGQDVFVEGERPAVEFTPPVKTQRTEPRSFDGGKDIILRLQLLRLALDTAEEGSCPP